MKNVIQYEVVKDDTSEAEIKMPITIDGYSLCPVCGSKRVINILDLMISMVLNLIEFVNVEFNTVIIVILKQLLRIGLSLGQCGLMKNRNMVIVK